MPSRWRRRGGRREGDAGGPAGDAPSRPGRGGVLVLRETRAVPAARDVPATGRRGARSGATPVPTRLLVLPRRRGWWHLQRPRPRDGRERPGADRLHAEHGADADRATGRAVTTP